MALPPGMTPRTQSDLLPEEETEITDTIKVPGIATLHGKSPDEIAAVLTNVVRSQANLISFKWVIGSHMEVVKSR